MAFELKLQESVSDGITRNVRSQIEKALGYLGAKSKLDAKRKPERRDKPEKEAVPEIRKCFKRVRAAHPGLEW